jgi:hypothetical protein
MGLLGAIIVRPNGFDPVTNRIAYEDPASTYTHENLFLMTDIDVRVHDAVKSGNLTNIDFADFHSVGLLVPQRKEPS